MPSIENVVDFLKTNSALKEQYESPWPVWRNEEHSKEKRYHIAWHRLFPQNRRRHQAEGDFSDEDEIPFDSEVFEDLIISVNQERKKGIPEEGELQNIAKERGWDVCSWYQPIHFFASQWGIFIKEDCIISQAKQIGRFLHFSVPTTPSIVWRLVRASTFAYFLHEQYHHKAECLGLRLHVIDRKSCYLPYFTMVYEKTKGTDDQLEEALANADSYRRLRTEPYKSWISDPVLQATESYLIETFPHDPPGYRMAGNYLSVDQFVNGENKLHCQMHEATLTPSQPVGDWEIATRLMQSMFKVTDNIWAIVPSGRMSLLPII